MFKDARKSDLMIAAAELGEKVSDKATKAELINIIKNAEKFKSDSEFVSNLIDGIIEERKEEFERLEKSKQLQLQLEQIKLERAKAELELSRSQINSKTNDSDSESKIDSLDSLVKSIKTLTIGVPSRQS